MKMIILAFIVFFLTLCTEGSIIDPEEKKGPRICKPQPIPAINPCHNLYYNYTAKKDGFSYDQDLIKSYWNFIPNGCSKKLEFLLCSMMVPMCDLRNEVHVPPCRPVCEDVKFRCQSALKVFGKSWPDILDCSGLPQTNTQDDMCMNGPTVNESSNHPSPKPVSRKCSHLKSWSKYIYVNKIGKCAVKCSANHLFTKNDKYMNQIWMTVLAFLCFLSTLFTFLTFLMDPKRFKYPERPIIYLAMCYNLFSISYFIRIFAGREEISCAKDNDSGLLYLIQNGLEKPSCAVVFLLHYYFSMASSLWWVMLTVTWFLAAGLKWGDEAIERKAGTLHFTAWSIPFVMTLIALIMNVVDADELAGMCSVGQQRPEMLLSFMIIPRLIFLFLGSSFFLGGFIALSQIRRHVKNDGIRTDKLDLLMVRIGLFSFLYFIPASCVTGIEIYEYLNRDSWISKNGGYPYVSIFMLKSFMSLVVGITSSIWIWSRKTLMYWSQFCKLKKSGHTPLVQHNFTSPVHYYPGKVPLHDPQLKMYPALQGSHCVVTPASNTAALSVVRSLKHTDDKKTLKSKGTGGETVI